MLLKRGTYSSRGVLLPGPRGLRPLTPWQSLLAYCSSAEQVNWAERPKEATCTRASAPWGETRHIGYMYDYHDVNNPRMSVRRQKHQSSF